MPDAEVAGDDGVVGGPEAQMLLQQRRLWIAEPFKPEATLVTGDSEYREESPQWIDIQTLLVARIDAEGQASLWQVDRFSGEAQQVVEEITPAPEQFGFYGYIDWGTYFALWQPPLSEAEAQVVRMAPTAVPPHPIPAQRSAGNGRTLLGFLQGLTPSLTSEQAVSLWGEPDAVTGSGLIIYQYDIGDGVWIWLGFPGDGPLAYAQLHTPEGKVFALTFMPADSTQSSIPATNTPTPHPMEMTPTPTPATQHSPLETPPTEPTPTPTAVIEATATPMSEATSTPLPGR
jgi:hypothetical protein